MPGKMLTVEAVEDFPGGRVMVPNVGDDTLDALKPKPMAKVQLMQEKVGEGLSKQQVLELLQSQPGNTATPKSPVLSSPVAPVANIPQAPLKVTQVALGANGKPLITAKSIKKLEAEAAKGNMQGVGRNHGTVSPTRRRLRPRSGPSPTRLKTLCNKHNINQGSQEVYAHCTASEGGRLPTAGRRGEQACPREGGPA